jgi:hypothetical protein
MNVSFSSTEPSRFIDCGRSSRTYAEGESVERFDYQVASSSQYKAATVQQAHPAFSNYIVVDRQPTLEGRSNIYVAPAESDPSKTVVSVNTRYIFTVKLTAHVFAKHLSGNVFLGRSEKIETQPIAFSTSEQGRQLENGQTIVCSANGTFESDILKIVQKVR